MKRTLALALALGLAPRAAHAWDGVCLNQLPLEGPTEGVPFYESVLCRQQTVPELCADGMAFPRGHYVGEHTLLSHLAMVWVGLESYTRRPTTGIYYSDGGAAPDGGDRRTPAHTGSMRREVQFRRPIAEFAEAPDASFSFSDFLMGNEHCLPDRIDGETVKEIESCHAYAGHIAPVNSSHFAPQHATMYARYHELAFTIARRCVEMKAAKVTSHLLGGSQDAQIVACEREALIMQSVASHFMADVWSIGHMWQRWGSPIVASRAPFDQFFQKATGAVSGLIHGWRALARPFFPGIEQHDQMCMPGFFEALPPGAENDLDNFLRASRWAYPPAVGQPDTSFFGAGDLYLLSCNALRQDPRWSLAPPNLGFDGRDATERPLSTQYRRMMTCLALGFEEVYQAGPKLLPDRKRKTTVQFDPAIRSSTDALCTEQRAINETVRMGAGVSNIGSLADPEIGSRIALRVKGVRALALARPELLPALNLAISVLTRSQITDIGLKINERAAEKPTGTDLADLTMVGPLFKYNPNSFYVDEIKNDLVDYLELGHMEEWSALGASALHCTTDKDCKLNQPHATYCDPGAIDETGARGGRCVPHEAAILRAFRDGETPYFCKADGKAALDAQRTACSMSGSRGSQECDACVQVVLPHLRNACSRAYYPASGRDTGGRDVRSLCDIYAARAGLVRGADLDASSLYAYYTDAAGAAQRARDICFAQPICTRGGCGEGRPPLLAVGGNATCARTCGGCTVCSGDRNPLLAPADVLQPVPNETFAAAEQLVLAGKGCMLAGGVVSCGVTGIPLAPVAGLPSDIVQISGNGAYCARTAGGDVWCWGFNSEGQVGDNTTNDRTVPFKVALSGAIDISMGAKASCAVTSGGNVLCWGDRNVSGINLRPDPLADTYWLRPQLVVRHQYDDPTPLSGLVEVGVGFDAACGRRGDGTVACWGNWGPSTGAIDELGQAGARRLSMAGGSLCVIAADRTVACAGVNLGDGTADNSPTFRVVPNLTNVEDIAVSGGHSCVRHLDGSLSCWGGNGQGQLQNGMTTVQRSPIQVRAACPAP